MLYIYIHLYILIHTYILSRIHEFIPTDWHQLEVKPIPCGVDTTAAGDPNRSQPVHFELLTANHRRLKLHNMSLVTRYHESPDAQLIYR